MYTTSLSGILETVLIILLVYFGIKMLIRWFGPLILKYIMRKVGKKFEDQFNQAKKAKEKKEGDVNIEKTPKNQPRSKKKVGEYIDYEEID